MPKEIRFSNLVQKSGKPETVTLWAAPQSNSAFMKAVKENRVVTVFQKPTGTKKDFGQIGFHQEKFATYLVFPKPLPKLGDVHVIGIKYELLKAQTENRPLEKERKPTRAYHRSYVHDGVETPPAAPPQPERKTEPARKFQVKIVRTATVETTVTVEAGSISQAEAKALHAIHDEPFKPDKIHDDVKSITEV